MSPNQPRAGVTVRGIRIPDDMWEQLEQAALEEGGEGTTPSAIVRAAIRQYLAKGTEK